MTQVGSEQTHAFYKVPDCYILVYCASADTHAPTKDEISQIQEWIQHKHIKMKDWLLMVAFEVDKITEFDLKKVNRKIAMVNQSVFQQKSFESPD